MTRARDLADLGQDKSTLASYVDTGVTSTDLERIDITTEGTSEASKVVTADSSGHVTLAGELRGPATLVIDPAVVGNNTGLLQVKGNLQVDGTTTTINSTTVEVDDKNIVLGSGAADSAAADGAGLTIDGASATMLYTHSTTSFDFNKSVNVTGNASVSGDLTVDTNTVKVDSSNNRVGIGTSSPEANSSLHIVSSGYQPLIVNTNNAGGGGLTVRHSDTQKMYVGSGGSTHLTGSSTDDALIRATNDFKISTGGNNLRFTIDSSGKVGIGGTPDEILHLKSSTSLNPILKIENTNADHLNAQINFVKNSASEADDDYLGQIDFEGLNDNDEMIVYGRLQSQAKDVSDGTEDGRVYISSMANGTLDQTFNVVSGNVGIGTTSPSARLSIEGSNNTLSEISLKNTSPNPDSHWVITPLYDQDTLAFRSANNSYANRMTISAGGNVTIPSGNLGIGDPSPSQMLNIKQTVNDAYTPTDYNDKSLITLNVPNAEDNYAGIRFTHAGGTEGLFGYHREAATSDRAEFVWQGYDGNANSYKEYMRLNWQGKLGIGGDPTGALLTGKSSGSDNAEVYLGATGSGQAGVVFDASNGDFAGSDYYMLRQIDSTLDVENWLGTSGDYIWKTNGGTERVRLYNDGRFKHVSGNTQLTKEQYAYSTSNFSSDGNWHTMLSGLNDHKVFLVRMYQSGGGFHTSALFIAANTYASGDIFTFSSGAGWASNVELRWTGTTYNYSLEGRSTGTNAANTFWRVKLINI